jgi:ribonuclease E
MTKKMLINTIDEEESRMAIVEEGRLVEFNIRMSARKPSVGDIYKGVVQKVERGLRAAFVNYGVRKNGFLPLKDVSPEYLSKDGDMLPVNREIIVQVVRDEKGNKGAMLTTHISLPGRYLVLMPNSRRSGVSRKIEDEKDRARLKELMGQIIKDEEMSFIVRTAGMNRTKQELSRDYQILLRLWSELKKKAESISTPTLIYQESDFAVRALRDYYTSDIAEILVDNSETCKKMKNYCKAVSPRTTRHIKLYKEDTPIFDKYHIESQIDAIYQAQVDLKSGGSIIVESTEALTTIDVNSGRASNKRDMEETAFRTNLEAAEEVARQLRLRDLGGLIVVDFIDMMDKKHITQVEKTFKNALKVDRSRIQLSRISQFGLLELSRQKKQSTIQEISYTACPYCKGSGVRPSIEYMALGAFRKIKSKVAKGNFTEIRVTLPREVSYYLLNQKKAELGNLENMHDTSIYISGDQDMLWGESRFDTVKKPVTQENTENDKEVPEKTGAQAAQQPGKKPSRSRRRTRRPRAKSVEKPDEAKSGSAESAKGETKSEGPENPQQESEEPAQPQAEVKDSEDSQEGKGLKKTILSKVHSFFQAK